MQGWLKRIRASLRNRLSFAVGWVLGWILRGLFVTQRLRVVSSDERATPYLRESASVLRTLRECKSLQALYQLHRNIKLDPKLQAATDFIANGGETEGCEGIWIRARVAPGGGSYTVQIGPAGQPRRYKSR